MEIKGKKALILGAAKGLGKAIALELAAAGATVLCTYYDWPEDAAQMQEELAGFGATHSAMRVDLRESEQVADLFDRVRERFGSLDILINNIERGGMPVVHGAYDRPANRVQWDLELATTLKAKWLVFHAALPLLKKAPEAAVVTLSSIAGVVGRSGPAALLFNDGYAAANRAVSAFTETWAREAAPTVRVNELMLGLVETRHAENTRGWDLLGAEEKGKLLDHTLLRRTGRLEEVVRAVLFLVRDATFMTGSVVRMDGGYVLGGDHVPDMPVGVL
ncbi:MAG: 3-oxoacyl-ACP reductase [Deltaproteobacteria bacterium RIFOXYD12_FULL_57_12]|nr:MAG: 3-oxoacyl-ACP reductase [Deltaproteobacteria bacterium RIFOXYD12_FULL_57_12]